MMKFLLFWFLFICGFATQYGGCLLVYLINLQLIGSVFCVAMIKQ